MTPGSSPSAPLAGRVAIVTGGGRGLGEAIAHRLARDGATVAVLDIDGPSAEKVAAAIGAAGGAAFPVPGDVTDGAGVREAVAGVSARAGAAAVLVNNAGGFPAVRRLDEIDEAEWDRIIALNLTSAFRCARAVIPGMRRLGWGRIINIASAAARTLTNLSAAHYAAAKAGLLGLTRHLALELGPAGITVNAVAPGTTPTERVRRLRPPDVEAEILRAIPVGRFGAPEDTAAAVAFLASPGAGYITGVTLDVNGGKAIM